MFPGHLLLSHLLLFVIAMVNRTATVLGAVPTQLKMSLWEGHDGVRWLHQASLGFKAEMETQWWAVVSAPDTWPAAQMWVSSHSNEDSLFIPIKYDLCSDNECSRLLLWAQRHSIMCYQGQRNVDCLANSRWRQKVHKHGFHRVPLLCLFLWFEVPLNSIKPGILDLLTLLLQ